MAHNRCAGRAAKSRRKKPDWVGAVLDEWIAANKSDADPLGLNGAPDWVMRAWTECVKIIFPGGLPDSPDKMGPEFLGELLGRLNALQRLYAGGISLGPETQTDLQKMEKAAKPLSRPANMDVLLKDWTVKSAANHQAMLQAVVSARTASHSDEVSFHQGLARGLEIQPDELATSRTFRRHTRTYFVLAAHWRTWVRCRSLKQVHSYLCQAAGERQVGSFKVFEKLCRKIGLKLRRPGRPPGVK